MGGSAGLLAQRYKSCSARCVMTMTMTTTTASQPTDELYTLFVMSVTSKVETGQRQFLIVAS